MPDGVDALCGILDRTIYVGGADLETCVVCIPENAPLMLPKPITHNGRIKYPTNKHIIGANPIAVPIIAFFDTNLSFESFLFS